MPIDSTFPDRLRELRLAAGMSLRKLASAVPCSHVHIHDVERGRKTPSAELVARLDQVLDAGGELATLCHSGQTQPGWRPRSDRFDQRQAEALAEALVAERPTADNALRLAHEWMVAEPPQLTHLRAGSRIGESTVAQVEQRVHQLRLLDDHLGGGDSYQTVAAELSATATLLREASHTEPIGRRLLVAVGELAQLAGWVASDAGRHRHAQHLYLTGAWAAHAGGDIAGAANNLSCLSYQMANNGDPGEAVLLAQTAATRAKTAPATVQALLAERVAWASARADEPIGCQRALDQAQELFTNRRPEHDPMWVYWLDASEMQIMAGRCWTQLRRPLRAVPVLRQATAGYGPDRAREAALYLSWLAEALLDAREVDEAAETALTALTLANSTASQRATDRLGLLWHGLRQWDGVSAVQEFADAYRSISEQAEPVS